MEIDLNNALSEAEKIKCCNGECDKKRGSGDSSVNCSLFTSVNSSSCSSNASFSASIYMELWHACAGPLTTLPKKGNVVVYFPQGHLEQIASASPYPLIDVPTFDLSPHIFCKVVDVELLANKENDEVYTKLTLLPLLEGDVPLQIKEHEEVGVDEEESGVAPTKSTSHMFCKTLTASDTSTHGGFSVPRRAAEDCFPPLDYKEQRPSQELIAKDLHGVEWKFRHIYRGQPRRHLLTTGWSTFASQKNLVSGDAVFFFRGDDGILRLGIRRAARPRNGLPDSVIKNQNSYTNILFPVANAIASKSTFEVFYSPRATHADLFVPYHKYLKSINNQISVGARFRMRLSLDDSRQRRISGVVTGEGDLDPFRWCKSKWRCLMVRWDEDILSNHQERVSPWEIDFSATFPPLGIQTSQRMKKLRTTLHADPHGSSFTEGGPLSDFEVSLRSSKVLQGQENVGFMSSHIACDTTNSPLDFEMQRMACQNPEQDVIEKTIHNKLVRSQLPTPYTGFLESNRFPKVLQGQEIYSFRSLTGKTELKVGPWVKPYFGCNVLDMYQIPKPNFYQGARNAFLSSNGIYETGHGPLLLSCVMNPQPQKHVLNPASLINDGDSNVGIKKDIKLLDFASDQKPPARKSSVPVPETYFKEKDEEILEGTEPFCKLFGFSLFEESHASNLQCSKKKSSIKVHKQGSSVGRAIDLSRLNGYDDLLIELERLFSMEGLLRDHSKGWEVLYTDGKNDAMVVGDDPWIEFCKVVSQIQIYTQGEVEKMRIRKINDDSQSCFEEAPAEPDVSKSSSTSPPDDQDLKCWLK